MGVVRGELREQSQNSPGSGAIQCRSAVQVLVNPNFLVHKLVAGVSILLSTNGLSLCMRFVPRGTRMRGLMVLILKMAPHIEMFHVEH